MLCQPYQTEMFHPAVYVHKPPICHLNVKFKKPKKKDTIDRVSTARLKSTLLKKNNNIQMPHRTTTVKKILIKPYYILGNTLLVIQCNAKVLKVRLNKTVIRIHICFGFRLRATRTLPFLHQLNNFPIFCSHIALHHP